ncbi:MFS transporter [Glutamicibacter mishrai]|uniref:MFS transporter n=1 Tax=Glutamicibacter mishrai TaxID=1775880 RepID=A0A6H0SJP5_9MICC|nr:MFS transporter [Glutamicibacter mishrai]QIV87346.1 MFS transporter [Glutamicibacter mishrai]
MSALKTSALRLIKPFAIRDYALLASALVFSTFAAGMWSVAMVYQVRRLDGGPVELSMVATANAVGLLCFVLFGGIMADRHSCRRIVLLVETFSFALMSITAILAISGALELWHLMVAGFFMGAASAFFYPSYSALLPKMLPSDQLLAANGLEGTVRPVVHTALGPMAAGFLVAALSPAHAIIGVALVHFSALLMLRRIPNRDAYNAAAVADGEAKPGIVRQLREGVGYTVRTRWLLWTLLFSVISVFTFIGPFEVLLPFIVSDNLHGDAKLFSFALAFFGVGSALGSLLIASAKFPRRYLSLMTACWCLGTLPLAMVGYVDEAWMLFIILLAFGITDAVGMVIWGTLLQRRVPSRLLGRISSLDFFVSLALMPLSMAVAGPLTQVLSLQSIFVIAGLASPVFGIIAWWAGKFARDEVEHPLVDEPLPVTER